MRIDQAQEVLGATRDEIVEWMKSGDIKYQKIASNVSLDDDSVYDLAEWLRDLA